MKDYIGNNTFEKYFEPLSAADTLIFTNYQPNDGDCKLSNSRASWDPDYTKNNFITCQYYCIQYNSDKSINSYGPTLTYKLDQFSFPDNRPGNNNTEQPNFLVNKVTSAPSYWRQSEYLMTGDSTIYYLKGWTCPGTRVSVSGTDDLSARCSFPIECKIPPSN